MKKLALLLCVLTSCIIKPSLSDKDIDMIKVAAVLNCAYSIRTGQMICLDKYDNAAIVDSNGTLVPQRNKPALFLKFPSGWEIADTLKKSF